MKPYESERTNTVPLGLAITGWVCTMLNLNQTNTYGVGFVLKWELGQTGGADSLLT